MMLFGLIAFRIVHKAKHDFLLLFSINMQEGIFSQEGQDRILRILTAVSFKIQHNGNNNYACDDYDLV